ncbi:MAG: hypothetical protein ACYTBZ_28880, partial [Planctomycetota bacterium]
LRGFFRLLAVHPALREYRVGIIPNFKQKSTKKTARGFITTGDEPRIRQLASFLLKKLVKIQKGGG